MSAEEGEHETKLEDGEIEDSDVEDGTYVPLARPDNFNPSLTSMQIQDEASDSPESEDESSNSDSDSGHRQPRAKRFKVKPKNQQLEPRKKKYDIWCTAVQEQILTEDMFGCDVTKSRRKYGVESYDYTIKYKLEDNYLTRPNDETEYTSSTGNSNKRTHSERKSVKLRLGKRENSYQEPRDSAEPKILPNLAVTENDPLEDIAKDIADNLKEEKKDLLLRIVECIGPGKAIQLYQETKRVEEDGGILVMNGYRRRTAGGVYIFLLKSSPWVSEEMQRRMFRDERSSSKRERRRAHAAHRDHKVQQLKQSLNDSELPALLSRSEAISHQHSTEHGSNPPPSPATDARECSSDTDTLADEQEQIPPQPKYQEPSKQEDVADYDDDFLEVNCTDDMDMF